MTEALESQAEDLLETFDRDGVVRIRGLISADWIARLRDAVEAVMASPAEFSRDLAEEGREAGRFFNEIFVSRRNDELRAFIEDSPIAEAAGRVMRSHRVRFFNDQLLVKEPGTSAETLWHQDLPYFPCDGEQVCSVWVGLDPVRQETGAMSFVKGSHRAGALYAPRNFGTGESYSLDGYDGPVPDIATDPVGFPTLCYDLEPGDVTIHHGLTLH
jgi:ectoine hydroxylase-related dioxygenase (phytanoyl-CoA dioxygenase family)